jgi:hypothetical protein
MCSGNLGFFFEDWVEGLFIIPIEFPKGSHQVPQNVPNSIAPLSHLLWP